MILIDLLILEFFHMKEHKGYPDSEHGGNEGCAPKTVLPNEKSNDGGGQSEVASAASGIYGKAHKGGGGGNDAMHSR